MPRQSEKSQYKKKEKRTIYLLRSPLSKEFFIGHCKFNSLMPIFRQHWSGDRYHTKDCFLSLKQRNLHPCLTVLEEVNCTQVEAYRYVVAWTKIFIDSGFTCLNEGNVMEYVNNLYEKSRAIYEQNKHKDITEICSCQSCVVSNYGYNKCPFYR